MTLAKSELVAKVQKATHPLYVVCTSSGFIATIFYTSSIKKLTFCKDIRAAYFFDSPTDARIYANAFYARGEYSILQIYELLGELA